MRPADLLTGAAGALLLGALFLRWYAVVVPVATGGARVQLNLTGWQSLSVIDVVLAVVALLAIALPLAQILRDSPAAAVAVGDVTAAAGIVAVVLIVFRIVDQPGSNRFVDVQGGAWIALVAALALLAGAWWSLATETLPGARPPRLARRPAPPAA